MSNGSDRMNFEEEAAGGGVASFSPPITPPVTGTPGSVSPGSVRVLQLVFPMSGPYKGRVSNFDW